MSCLLPIVYISYRDGATYCRLECRPPKASGVASWTTRRGLSFSASTSSDSVSSGGGGVFLLAESRLLGDGESVNAASVDVVSAAPTLFSMLLSSLFLCGCCNPSRLAGGEVTDRLGFV